MCLAIENKELAPVLFERTAVPEVLDLRVVRSHFLSASSVQAGDRVSHMFSCAGETVLPS